MNDFNNMGTPWWISSQYEDYTKRRSSGVSYTTDDLIGRKDVKKYALATDDVTTASGIDAIII